ncbi:MAG TPA: hypothetical protein VMF53_13590 [Alphaproteobacteria bacterium]|nr:hypothetical protein [Alphaproteobacteria bacterium]
MMTREDTALAATRGRVRRSEVVTRVAGVEGAKPPHGLVRIGLEGEEGPLLLEMSEEAAMQLLAYLLKVLPKRGLRK